MRHLIIAVILIGSAACTEEPATQASREQEATSPLPTPMEGFILKVGGGEPLLNGIVVKASPKTGTMGSILVEQTFQRGGTTNLHIHDQGDELFYVVSGRGTATLGDQSEVIEPGDVIFVPRSAVHRISNLENDEPLTVVFLHGQSGVGRGVSRDSQSCYFRTGSADYARREGRDSGSYWWFQGG